MPMVSSLFNVLRTFKCPDAIIAASDAKASISFPHLVFEADDDVLFQLPVIFTITRNPLNDPVSVGRVPEGIS